MAESSFLRSQLFAAHGLHGIFSLRNGGVSHAPYDSLNLADDTGDNPDNVQRNMQILLRRCGINDMPHRARQVHGCESLSCKGAGRMHNEQADILISGDGSPVAVRVADCTPILLADTSGEIVAAVHAGWRGTAAGVVMHAIQALLSTGARVENIVACVGPCIGPCCFEISLETASELRGSCAGADAFVLPGNGRLFADLAAINHLQLVQTGLGQANIETLAKSPATCTCCNAHDFFSYRRDGRGSGRHLAIVAPMTSA